MNLGEIKNRDLLVLKMCVLAIQDRSSGEHLCHEDRDRTIEELACVYGARWGVTPEEARAMFQKKLIDCVPGPGNEELSRT